jgi:hypothetical protein
MGWAQRQAAAREQAGQGAAAAVWRRRRRACALALVARDVALARHKAALLVLDVLLREDPADAEAWSQAGRVQLSLGDAAAAAGSFERGAAAAAALAEPAERAHALEQAGMDAALVRLLSGAAPDDLREYTAIAEQDGGGGGGGAAAVLGAAASLLYEGNVGGAVRTLEEAFAEAPGEALDEAPVLGLASLYELRPDAAAAQARMGAWVGAAPDDFSLACSGDERCVRGAAGVVVLCGPAQDRKAAAPFLNEVSAAREGGRNAITHGELCQALGCPGARATGCGLDGRGLSWAARMAWAPVRTFPHGKLFISK